MIKTVIEMQNALERKKNDKRVINESVTDERHEREISDALFIKKKSITYRSESEAPSPDSLFHLSISQRLWVSLSPDIKDSYLACHQ